MKRDVIQFQLDRPKRRAQFLFNDGEFRPRTERTPKQWVRRPKNRRQDWFSAAE